MTMIAVPGGWMVEDDDNIYPTQAEAIATQHPTHIVFHANDGREQTLTLRFNESLDDARQVADDTAPLGWYVTERQIYAGNTLIESR